MNNIELYFAVLSDIENKYQDNNPNFLIDEALTSAKDDILAFIDNAIREEKWVLYTKLDSKRYKLNAYFPRPLARFCLDKIDRLLDACKKKWKKVLYRIGDTIFFESQVRQELLIAMREGFSEISVKEGGIADGREIFLDISYQNTEVHWQLESGYLFLEYKDSFTYVV